MCIKDGFLRGRRGNNLPLLRYFVLYYKRTNLIHLKIYKYHVYVLSIEYTYMHYIYTNNNALL